MAVRNCGERNRFDSISLVWEGRVSYKTKKRTISRFHKYWCELHRESSYHPRELRLLNCSKTGVKQNIVNIIPLNTNNVLKVTSESTGSTQPAFQIMAIKSNYVLTTETPEQAKTWCFVLERELFGPPHKGEVYHYMVEVVQNSTSKEYGIKGHYLLKVFDDMVRLYTPNGQIPLQFSPLIQNVVKVSSQSLDYKNGFNINLLILNIFNNKRGGEVMVFQAESAGDAVRVISHRKKILLDALSSEEVSEQPAMPKVDDVIRVFGNPSRIHKAISEPRKNMLAVPSVSAYKIVPDKLRTSPATPVQHSAGAFDYKDSFQSKKMPLKPRKDSRAQLPGCLVSLFKPMSPVKCQGASSVDEFPWDRGDTLSKRPPAPLPRSPNSDLDQTSQFIFPDGMDEDVLHYKCNRSSKSDSDLLSYDTESNNDIFNSVGSDACGAIDSHSSVHSTSHGLFDLDYGSSSDDLGQSDGSDCEGPKSSHRIYENLRSPLLIRTPDYNSNTLNPMEASNISASSRSLQPNDIMGVNFEALQSRLKLESQSTSYSSSDGAVLSDTEVLPCEAIRGKIFKSFLGSSEAQSTDSVNSCGDIIRSGCADAQSFALNSQETVQPLTAKKHRRLSRSESDLHLGDNENEYYVNVTCEETDASYFEVLPSLQDHAPDVQTSGPEETYFVNSETWLSKAHRRRSSSIDGALLQHQSSLPIEAIIAPDPMMSLIAETKRHHYTCPPLNWGPKPMEYSSPPKAAPKPKCKHTASNCFHCDKLPSGKSSPSDYGIEPAESLLTSGPKSFCLSALKSRDAAKRSLRPMSKSDNAILLFDGEEDDDVYVIESLEDPDDTYLNLLPPLPDSVHRYLHEDTHELRPTSYFNYSDSEVTPHDCKQHQRRSKKTKQKKHQNPPSQHQGDKLMKVKKKCGKPTFQEANGHHEKKPKPKVAPRLRKQSVPFPPISVMHSHPSPRKIQSKEIVQQTDDYACLYPILDMDSAIYMSISD